MAEQTDGKEALVKCRLAPKFKSPMKANSAAYAYNFEPGREQEIPELHFRSLERDGVLVRASAAAPPPQGRSPMTESRNTAAPAPAKE